MNSIATLPAEEQDTSSIQTSSSLRQRMPHMRWQAVEYLLDATTVKAIVFTSPSVLFTITTPRTDFTLEPKRLLMRPSSARLVLGPLEFELNPIVRVYPPTGKRYPMRVIRQHTASFRMGR